jgi:hypothetical protein
MKKGSIAVFMGNWAVEKGAPWKSPTAGLSHSAWKSGKRGRDFHFFHRPDHDGLTFHFFHSKKNS